MTKVIVSSQVRIKKHQNIAPKYRPAKITNLLFYLIASQLFERDIIYFFRKPKQRKINSHDGGSCFIAG